VAGGGSGERRRRGHGGAPAAARVSARVRAAVGASQGPRGGAELLGWRWALSEGVLVVAAATMAATNGVLARELRRRGYI
jgi:hypothetical protein